MRNNMKQIFTSRAALILGLNLSEASNFNKYTSFDDLTVLPYSSGTTGMPKVVSFSKFYNSNTFRYLGEELFTIQMNE